MVAAHAVPAWAVPVAIPATHPAVGVGSIGRQQSVSQGPPEHTLVPGSAQVAHVILPQGALLRARRGEAGANIQPLEKRSGANWHVHASITPAVAADPRRITHAMADHVLNGEPSAIEIP